MFVPRSLVRPMSAEQAARLLKQPRVSPVTLRRILYNAPEPFKGRAWRRLAAVEDPNGLRGVFYSALPAYQIKAADLMIQARCGFSTIFMHAPKVSRVKAARVLLREPATDIADLAWVLKGAPEPYRRRAWGRICALPPTPARSKLLRAMIDPSNRWPTQAYRRRAILCALAGGITADLLAVLYHAPDADKVSAAEKLLTLDDNCVRTDVLRYAPESFVSEARRRLEEIEADRHRSLLGNC